MVDDHLPIAAQFMDEYYKLLAMKRYGKKVAAIKREVRQMGKNQAIKWIEQTYRIFIKDAMDIFNIMNNLHDSSIVKLADNGLPPKTWYTTLMILRRRIFR